MDTSSKEHKVNIKLEEVDKLVPNVLAAFST